MNMGYIRLRLADSDYAVLLLVLSFARRETTEGRTAPWPRMKMPLGLSSLAGRSWCTILVMAILSLEADSTSHMQRNISHSAITHIQQDNDQLLREPLE